MYTMKGDTWQIAIGWQDRELYGEGGLFVVLGKTHIFFWRRPDYGDMS